jgi:hypothetical protein
LGLGTLLRIKPRARRSFLTKERPSGDASGSLSQPTRIVYASGSGGSGQLAAEVACQKATIQLAFPPRAGPDAGNTATTGKDSLDIGARGGHNLFRSDRHRPLPVLAPGLTGRSLQAGNLRTTTHGSTVVSRR